MCLTTPGGPFSVTVLDERGQALTGDVAAGQEDPPRGWLSRYYAEKIAVPSLVVERRGQLPLVMVSVLCGGEPQVTVVSGDWFVRVGPVEASFRVQEGLVQDVRVTGAGAA
jgi:hypothetical protein